VSKLAESVLEYIRRQRFLRAGDRAGVAVSGGADSVALLRLLLELHQEIGVVLSVVHFNHNLRGAESDADERFVAQLAGRHDLELHCDRGDVAKQANLQRLSTEAAARQLRYQYFLRLMEKERLNCVATGHTLDDQAETVLLRMVRGAGTRGLAGIYPQLSYSQSPDMQSIFPRPTHSQSTVSEPTISESIVSESAYSQSIYPKLLVNGSQFSVIRPLLRTGRTQLEAYLREIGQDWREDSSNRDLRHARNRVRHGIVPRLQRTLNPKVKEVLAETAEIARSEEEYWQKEVRRVLPGVWEVRTRTLTGLDALPMALRRRVVRAAGESLGLRLEFRHVEGILGLASASSALTVLPQGWVLSRTRDKPGLQFKLREGVEEISDYEYVLKVPGVVQAQEAGTWFEAAIVPGDAEPGYNPDHVFDPELLQKELTVRNWRAGDRFWPAHSKSPKKIKELLQERKLAAAERRLWPVVVSGREIVWLRGFPAPARLRPRKGAKAALVIQEYSKA
jgi:tRNA(Ile)-lysidine synthase